MNNKLITLLQTFSKEDILQFKKFVNSSYFNENESVSKLLELLIPNLNASDPILKKLTKEKIWSKLFHKTPFVDTKYRRLFSDLNKLASQFLSQKSFAEPITYQINLLKIYNRPELEKHYNFTLNTIEELFKNEKQSPDFYYNKLQFSEQQHLFSEQITKNKPTNFDHIESADYSLECFYVLQKLKFYCDNLGYNNLYKKTFKSIQHIDFILENLEQSEVIRETVVYAYSLVIKLLDNPKDDQNYFLLKNILAEKSNFIDPTELEILYTHLRNFCIIYKINLGYIEYINELFEIFKIQLSKNLLLKNNVLNVQNYKNIITVALRVKAFDWLEQFIKDYTSKLPEHEQTNALSYNLANVYFFQKKFTKVIEQLRFVEFNYSNYALGSKLLMIRTYYELGEYNALDSLLESFRIYLLRNKQLTKETKMQYSTIIRMIKKLSNINLNNKSQIKELAEKIRSSENNVAKQWLLDKIEELEKI